MFPLFMLPRGKIALRRRAHGPRDGSGESVTSQKLFSKDPESKLVSWLIRDSFAGIKRVVGLARALEVGLNASTCNRSDRYKALECDVVENHWLEFLLVSRLLIFQ